MLDVQDLEGVARRAFVLAGHPESLPSPLELAVACGMRVFGSPSLPVAALVLDDKLYYCTSMAQPAAEFAVARLLAERLLRAQGLPVISRDVWVLTGLLAAPWWLPMPMEHPWAPEWFLPIWRDFVAGIRAAA